MSEDPDSAAPALWPQTARFDAGGELWLGGCAATRLAGTYGTPLYIFDEVTLRDRARAYQAALARHYPAPAQTAYASKAYLCLGLAQLFAQEGLDLDVVSGGELHVALRAGFPAGRIHFHGNNKTPEELALALEAGVGRIVVDNFHELELLAGMAARRGGEPARIWLRLSPGVDAHTHAHIQTGQIDSKFGFSIAAGDAGEAVCQALDAPALRLVGLHCHIGSQIYEPQALSLAAMRLVEFAGEMRARHGFELLELSPGGGWGVPMVAGDPPAPIEDYVAAVAGAVVSACRAAGLSLPRLILEPGRSLAAPAGVALYRVGGRKVIPGVRTYVAIDGGMADNIRPALYGASYTAALVGRPAEGPRETVTLAGKFCESGDILIRDIELPALRAGDLLAVPMAGAYTLSMASNYNLARRPAVLLVNNGQARLLQRRESYADLLARDAPLNAGATHGRRPRFRKYQALGNDYLVLDPADFPSLDAELARRLCDRHRGVGADGVLWGPAEPAEPFALRMFNPDGSEFEKSGNGLRIFARALWEMGLPAGPRFHIATPVGVVAAHVLDPHGDRIAVDMGRLTFDSAEIPLAGPPRQAIDETLMLPAGRFRCTAVGIGNPHCVLFFDEVTPALAHELGPQVERHELFPHRTNVQFVRVLDAHTLYMEIWERGVGYTLASGTSSCAAAGAAIRTGRAESPITVRMPGGELLIEIGEDWSVRMTGDVRPVCAGEVLWDD